MNAADILLKEFDLLADTPGGVKKLRELILQLAVQGKLVPQDPNDEPARVLLEKIKEEKNRLVKAGKIKPQKPLPPIESAEVPYELPIGWEWVRLGEVTDRVHYGYTASADESIKNIRLLRITDIQDDKVDWEMVPGCTIKSREIPKYLLTENDILIARTGGTIGKSFLVNKIPVQSVFASYLIRVIPSHLLSALYIKLFLGSYLYWVQLYEASMGTGQPNVNGVSLSLLRLPLPSLAEQHRIVAKVDQLMALCDELEKRQQSVADLRISLNNASLDKLLTASEPKKFDEHWRRITTNFDLLYDHPETVGKLRQAFLQLAVQGKLVPQDPKDEPASVLLEKIKKDRERTRKNGDSRVPAEISNVSTSEHCWITPSSWMWARMASIFLFIDYRGRTPTKLSSGVRLITAKNIRMGYISLEPEEFISEKEYKSWMTRGFPRKGDLLFTTEAPLGNIAVLEIDDRIALAQRTIDLRPFSDLFSNYAALCIRSESFQKQLLDNATGMTATGIKSAKLKLLPFPVPPLAEQRRIVAKVDELMALCDELEKHIQQAHSTGERLMGAVAHGVVG